MDYYGFCNNENESSYIVPVLASVLNQLIARNDKMPINPESVTRFHAFKPPTISVQNYLNRVVKYVSCSTECFIMALIYIDRIIQRNSYFIITSLNVHRLLITSVMLAMKFFEDSYYTNAYYAKVGGVLCLEMNALEKDFLFLIDFSLNVTPDLFNRYRAELVKHAFNYCGCPCGADPVSMTIPRHGSGMPDWNISQHYSQHYVPTAMKVQYASSPLQYEHVQPQQRLTIMVPQNHKQNKNNSVYYHQQQSLQHHYQPQHYQPVQQAPISAPQYHQQATKIPPQIIHHQPNFMTTVAIPDSYNDVSNIVSNNLNINSSNAKGSDYSHYQVLSVCEAMVEDEVKRNRLSSEILPRASQLFMKEVMKHRSFSPYIMCNIMQRVCESLEKEHMYLPRASLVARALNAEAYIKAI